MDIHWLVAFFSLSALLVNNCVRAQNCEQSRYERCLQQLMEFAEKGDLLFARSAHELGQECVQAQSSLGCLTTYARKCLSVEERTLLNEAISGPQKLTLGLCTDETNLKSRYVNSLSCLRNVSEGLQYCKEKYDRNQKDIILYEYEDKTHLKCCSFDGYRRCLRMVSETNGDECREATIDVVDELALRRGGIYSEDLCTEYFERCTGHSAAPSHQLLLNLPLLILLSMLLLLWRSS